MMLSLALSSWCALFDCLLWVSRMNGAVHLSLLSVQFDKLYELLYIYGTKMLYMSWIFPGAVYEH